MHTSHILDMYAQSHRATQSHAHRRRKPTVLHVSPWPLSKHRHALPFTVPGLLSCPPPISCPPVRQGAGREVGAQEGGVSVPGATTDIPCLGQITEAASFQEPEPAVLTPYPAPEGGNSWTKCSWQPECGQTAENTSQVCLCGHVGDSPILGCSPSFDLLCDPRQVPVPLWVSPF